MFWFTDGTYYYIIHQLLWQIIYSSLPVQPNVSLMFSEIGDPSNTTTNFVEIYNAGSTSVDFTNHYSWFLSVNGSSSVQLTGTLAAGAKYTVAK